MVGRDVWGAGGEEKRRASLRARTENQDLFLFQTYFRPHMVLVLAYILRIAAVTHDPAPQTNMILAVSL